MEFFDGFFWNFACPARMNFTVYYISDRARSECVEAGTHEMAAWQFVQMHPPEKPAKLAIILTTPGWRRSGEVVVWWSSAFAGHPPPSNQPEPELRLITTGSREISHEICGAPEALRLFASQLLDALDCQSEPLAPDQCVYCVELEGDGGGSCLSFFANPDRKRDTPVRVWPVRIVLLLVLSLVVIGFITVVRWFL